MLVANLLLLATTALGAVVPYDSAEHEGIQYDDTQYTQAAAKLFRSPDCKNELVTINSVERCLLLSPVSE
ncbi:hypothetical protein H634G_04212 [Metarhizium anisopliae BRIP 53293]|uniref:Uncharacterized protein n=1 Tax=Metarhizium anisopliae BRIP 53293 TaxID=1291518 RepID=A0A0D9P1J4_METAN|nr:hypothetical protein H634G_04212 [Metarhizium anisopliae BRIP 53293]KJK91670.1 hypothetical protein H633G_04415 [Metarhizium anisopliae BRIP 53284]